MTTVAQLESAGLAISDGCTSDADLTVSHSDASSGTCPIVVTRTYTVKDKCNNSSTVKQTININRADFTVPANGSKTVNCPSQVEAPTLPAVTDACGNTLTGQLKNGYPSPSTVPSCEGTVTYVYTFTDCAGHAHDWTYVYTIDRTTPPAEVGGPVATSANVTCLDQATAPTTLPVIKDQCGNTLSPVGNPTETVTWEEGKTNCKGTKKYSYTYKDCANQTKTWVFTYNINDNVAPTITGTLAAVEVSGCATTAAPAAMTTVAELQAANLTVNDGCSMEGMTVNHNDAVSGTCPIVITRSYTVTDRCGNTSDPIQQTITVKHTVNPSEEGSVTNSADVTCLDQATPPTVDMLPVIKDQCGNVLNPVGEPTTEVTWQTGKENCVGTKIYTYSYKDCANLPATWVFTYNINDNVAPTISGSLAAVEVSGCSVDDAPAMTTVAQLEAANLTINDGCSTENMTVAHSDEVNDPLLHGHRPLRQHQRTRHPDDYYQAHNKSL